MVRFPRKVLHGKNYRDKHVLVRHNYNFGVVAVDDPGDLLRFYFGKGGGQRLLSSFFTVKFCVYLISAEQIRENDTEEISAPPHELQEKSGQNDVRGDHYVHDMPSPFYRTHHIPPATDKSEAIVFFERRQKSSKCDRLSSVNKKVREKTKEDLPYSVINLHLSTVEI